MAAMCPVAAPAMAQVERIPSSGGEVIIPGPPFAPAYYEFGYAPARRVGDTLYVSGVIIYRGEGEGTDAAAFEAQAASTFAAVADRYAQSVADPAAYWAAEAGRYEWETPWEDVVDHNFHRSRGPIFAEWFRGGRTNACFNALDRHVKSPEAAPFFASRTFVCSGRVARNCLFICCTDCHGCSQPGL